MTAEFPRCAVCRVPIGPGQNVIFRIDGRVQHTECPKVICPVCELPVLPAQPIRREGERLVHANCWMRVYRTSRWVRSPGHRRRRPLRAAVALSWRQRTRVHALQPL